jgi:hypothetical protein
MSPPAARAVALTRHPDSRGNAVRAIAAEVRRHPDGTLAVAYTIAGDLERVRVPDPRPAAVADRLWEHTCCEIFIACAGSPSYHELNLAPSSEWAAYAFEGYRERVPFADPAPAPQVTTRRAAGTLELDALIRLDCLSPHYAGATLSLGLTAVIEDASGALDYWALRHPPGKPDFHHRDAFALEL